MSKCSLLQLSMHLDDELEPRRRGEIEAHLVGCDRCRRGRDHLAEERERIAGLARVRVSDESVGRLMAEVGLIEDGAAIPVRGLPTPKPRRPASPPPWLAGAVGKALPWVVPVNKRGVVHVEAFRGTTIAATRTTEHRGVAGEADDVGDPSAAVRSQSSVPATDDHTFALPSKGGLPVPSTPVTPSTPPTDPISIENSEGLPVPGPHRAAGLGLLARLRERVALHRALSHASHEEFDDSVESREFFTQTDVAGQPTTEVRGTPMRRPRQRPAGERGADAVHSTHGQTLVAAMVESWVGGLRRRPRLAGAAAATMVLLLVGLGVGKSITPLGSSVSSSIAHAAQGAPRPSAQQSEQQPGPAGVTAPSPIASQGTPGQLSDVRILGAAASGWQIKGIRYGEHGPSLRVVFDLAPGAAATGSTPKATIGFADPATLFTVLDGVIPSGSVGQLPSTTSVASVSLVEPAPAPGQAVYKFKLAHPLVVTQRYMTNPVRLVLDMR